jgi:hypothetical protein
LTMIRVIRCLRDAGEGKDWKWRSSNWLLSG